MDWKSLLGKIGKGWIITGVVALVLFLLVSTWVSYFNRDKELRVQFENQTRANQADFDNMWKTIAQKYQVKGDFEKEFKDIFVQVAAGRSGGALFKSVQEAAPGLDQSIYREVMATIEGKRNQFESHQKVLSDIKAQDDVLISQIPGCIFLFNRVPLQLKMITSSRTDNAFAGGQDNDVQLK